MNTFKARGVSQSARRSAALRLAILSAVLAVAIPVGSANAQANAKWFVLRDDQTSDCWTARLSEVDSAYHHAFSQKAGGPYDTKKDALKREQELERDATCNVPRT